MNFAVYLAVFSLLFVLTNSSLAPPPGGGGAGGWRSIDPSQPRVLHLASFAVGQLNVNRSLVEALSLQGVERVQRQVVQGMMYRMDLLLLNAHDMFETHRVKVWDKLGTLHLREDKLLGVQALDDLKGGDGGEGGAGSGGKISEDQAALFAAAMMAHPTRRGGHKVRLGDVGVCACACACAACWRRR